MLLSVTGGDSIEVSLNGFEVTFTVPDNWNGQEDFTFYVDDQMGHELVPDVVTVIVNPINDPPEIEILQIVGFYEDVVQEVDFSPYVTDVDGMDGLIMTSTQGENIFVEIQGFTVFFSSTLNWHGREFITFYLNDQQGRAVDSDIVEVVVISVNDAPTIDLPETLNFAEDTVLNEDFSSLIEDVDGDELILTADGFNNINVVIDGMQVTYDAPLNWNGTEVIVFTVDDQIGRGANKG